jgi:intergrase/recombinase
VRICLGSLAWWGTALVRDNINLSDFRTWLFSRYSKNYAYNIFNYSRKYSHMLGGDLRELQLLSPSVRDHVIKALIALSKYSGVYDSFKSKLKNYGIKLSTPDTFSAFLRILNGNSSDVLKWYNEAKPILRENERIFLKYVLYSGLRKEEGIKSFNRIIELSKANKLSEYYDTNLNCLMHFKYPKDFIRRTKNCFISFALENLIMEIANSEPITYGMIRKRLHRNKLKCRINELRDYFGTYLLQHGILEPEINLLQGRIPPSIFIRHYWSPKLSELKDRTLKAISELEQTLNN